MIIASFPKGSFPENSWPVGTWPVATGQVVIQYTEVMEFSLAVVTLAEFDVVLPNDDVVVISYPDRIVSGAGSTEYNGTYAETGTKNGYPRYIKPYANIREGLFIVSLKGWGTTTWVISAAGLDGDQNIQIMSGARYYSEDDVARPDLVTNWIQAQGALPLPTVTSKPDSILTEIVNFTVEMPMIIDFEPYEELSA